MALSLDTDDGALAATVLACGRLDLLLGAFPVCGSGRGDFVPDDLPNKINILELYALVYRQGCRERRVC